MIINDECIFDNCLINTNIKSNIQKMDEDVLDDLQPICVNKLTNDEVKEVEMDDEEVNLDEIEEDEVNLDGIENEEVNLDNLDEITLEKIDDSKNEIETNNTENIKDTLTEIDPFSDLEYNGTEPLKIKEPNEVYFEMYKKARLEAKEAKIRAQRAYLEAKQIKELHLLDISDSDSDSDSDINEIIKHY